MPPEHGSYMRPTDMREGRTKRFTTETTTPVKRGRT